MKEIVEKFSVDRDDIQEELCSNIKTCVGSSTVWAVMRERSHGLSLCVFRSETLKNYITLEHSPNASQLNILFSRDHCRNDAIFDNKVVSK